MTERSLYKAIFIYKIQEKRKYILGDSKCIYMYIFFSKLNNITENKVVSLHVSMLNYFLMMCSLRIEALSGMCI